MSAVLGEAIELLARQAGGQLIVELPDELSPALVRTVVAAARGAANGTTNVKAVYDARSEIQSSDEQSHCNFRELAQYREGNLLAVAYASDNRGMNTYSSVLQKLLSPAFPDEPKSPADQGVTTFPQFVDAIVDTLVKRSPDLQPARARLWDSVSAVGTFLRDAYLRVGVTSAAPRATWWTHVFAWLSSLEAAIESKEFGDRGDDELASLVYSTAGLPCPDDASRGYEQLTPKAYVAILSERWTTAAAARIELERLKAVNQTSQGPALLGGLPWTDDFDKASLFTDSLIVPVALVGSGALGSTTAELSSARLRGWEQLSEADFINYQAANAELKVFAQGVELPAPGTGGPQVLACKSEFVDEIGTSFEVSSFGILIPWRSKPIHEAPGEKEIESLEFYGVGGCQASFKATEAHPRQDGILVLGELNMQLSEKTPGVARFKFRCPAAAASLGLVDVGEGSFVIVGSSQAALFARQAPANRRARWKTIFKHSNQSEPASLEVPIPGLYDVAIVAPSESKPPAITIGGSSDAARWPGAIEAEHLFVIQARILETATVVADGYQLFEIAVANPQGSELSPLRACAMGTVPDLRPVRQNSVLGEIESAFCGLEILASQVDGALGAALAIDSISDSAFFERIDGVLISHEITDHLQDIEPGVPSAELVESKEYRDLGMAYRGLEIPIVIEALEQANNTQGLSISRVNLSFIDLPKLEALLAAYATLVRNWGSRPGSDGFWARHPFSLALFPAAAGFRQPSAVLLSPLHPIRLAWLWSAQSAATSEFEEGGEPLRVLQLLDSDVFPALTSFLDLGSEVRKFIPVPIDTSPQDVFIGWHALVPVSGSGPIEVPQWLKGKRFPVAGLSGLAPSSISAATSDFLRVNPQAQCLEISLTAHNPSSRSNNMDEGVLDVVGALASASGETTFVKSVRIVDSENRLGPMPSLSALRDDLAMGASGFGVEWTTRVGAESQEPHICFVEGSAATSSVQSLGAASTCRIPPIPLRRYPRYTQPEGAVSVLVDYSLSREAGNTAFESALLGIETSPKDEALAIRIRPNLAALKTPAKWVVIGSHGVDPATLARSAPAVAGTPRMLWDWRPAAPLTAIRSTKSGGAQPYSILAKVPPALSASVAKKVKEITGCTGSELDSRVKAVISTLSSRAIGLNTLLSVGHHQATGALGFFFSLKLLEDWLSTAGTREIRAIIPIDAVDPLLRDIAADGADSKRRADLMAISIVHSESRASVRICPIEIKHYGLESSQSAKHFPNAETRELVEHREQLAEYRLHLDRFKARLTDASTGSSAVMYQQVASLIECGMQLAPFAKDQEASASAYQAAISNVLAGTFDLEIMEGLLFWFQPNCDEERSFSILAERELDKGTLPRVGYLAVNPSSMHHQLWAGARLEEAEAALAWAFSGASPAAPLAPSSRNSGPPENAAQFEVLRTEAIASRIEEPDRGDRSDEGRETVGPGRLKTQELESRYQALLRAFDEFKVKVRRPDNSGSPYREGPSFVEFAIVPAYGVPVSRIQGQLPNVKLRLGLEEHMRIGSRTHLGQVLVSVPKQDSERYFVDANEMWQRWHRPTKGFSIPLGEDIVGEIVHIDFADANSPHLLLAGVTGGGKSEALLTILMGAAQFYDPSQVRLKMVDPKGTELTALQGLPHTDGTICWNAEQAGELLQNCVEEMEARYKLFASSGVRSLSEYHAATGKPLPRWLVVLDEYADLTSDDDDRKALEAKIKRLAQKARAAGIHLIISTQKPVVKVINTVIKGNLPAAVALRCNNQTESRVILDDAGAEDLTGKGDALLKIGASIRRLQFGRWSAPNS